MSENQPKRLPLPLIIAAYIFAMVELAIAVFGVVVESKFGNVAVDIVEILTAVFAILYFAKGYSKDARKYFRWYFLFLASTFLFETFFAIFNPDKMISSVESQIGSVISLISYTSVLVLGITKDIGKLKSVLLSLINVVIYVCMIVLYGIDYQSTASMDSLELLFASVAWLSGALLGVIMVFAKYSDKEARGTK